jgi:hypothetical protein
VTLSANGITRGGIAVQASYTWSRSRDQASSSEGGGQRGFAGQTAGANPNDREWARSDFERRHAFLTVLTWPASAALELTGIARLTSGTPYTPLVSGDINGTGRATIAPSSTPWRARRIPPSPTACSGCWPAPPPARGNA